MVGDCVNSFANLQRLSFDHLHWARVYNLLTFSNGSHKPVG
jgi:hypothetical protein